MTLRDVTYSHDLETALLACAVIYEETLPEVHGVVSPDDFHDPSNALLWAAMTRCHTAKEPVDQFSVVRQLELIGRRDLEGRLLELWERAPLPRPLAHAKTIRDLARRREAISALSGLVAEGKVGDIESAAWFAKVDAVTTGISSTTSTYESSDTTESLRRFWDRSIRIREAGGLLGHRSGIASLDHLIGGFWSEQLTTLAGRPSAGKSALLETAAVNVTQAGAKALYISAEMSESLMWPRLLAKVCNLNANSIREQSLTATGFADLTKAMNWFQSKPFRLVAASGMTIADIRALVRREKQKHGVDIVFVDYLQRIRASVKHDRRDLEIGEVSNGLAELARDLDMPVVAGAQVNRQVANRPDKRPMVSDLRESGSIENDSDTIVLIHREAQYAKQKDPEPLAMGELPPDLGAAELIVGKNRNGDVGIANCRYTAELCLFSDENRSWQ